MADMKKQLSNVAFGGSWSEEILDTSTKAQALRQVEAAVLNCFEEDVRTDDLNEALDYLREKIGKGSELISAFLQALNIQTPALRQQEASRVFRLIKNWAG